MRKILCICACLLVARCSFGDGLVAGEIHEIRTAVVDGVEWTYKTGYPYLETDYGKSSALYPESAAGQTGSGNIIPGGAIPAFSGVYIGDGANASVSATVSGHITIPSYIDGYRVIGVSENAFYDCINITDVAIPNEVLTIEEGAFARCSGLQSMTVPFIGKSRGKNSNGAENLLGWFFGRTMCVFSSNTIDNSEKWEQRNFTDIGGRQWSKYWTDHYVESYCLPASLEALTLTDETSLEDSAFCGQKLVKVTLSQNLQSIAGGVFAGMPIAEIELPEGLSVINYSMFQDCTSLTNVVIPSTVSTLGGSVFRNCTSLKEINLPANVAAIGDNAFNNSGIVRIPDMPNVTGLPDGIFENCLGLTEVAVPYGVASIGKYAFCGAKNLTRVVLPDTVISISTGAFDKCPNLVELNLGKSIENIEDYVFRGEFGTIGYHLTELDFPASIRKVSSWPVALTTVNIHDIGKWCEAKFDADASRHGDLTLQVNGEDAKRIVIPDGVESICDYAFCNYTNIEEVVCPSTVTNIGKFAFSGCKGLRSINIPDGVVSIGDGAFEESGMEVAFIPDSVTDFGEYVFNGCADLTHVRMSEAVTNIELEVFRDCSNLESVNLPAGLLSIGSYAFLNCRKLDNIAIPDCVKTIGVQAFKNCSSLSGILRIPSGVTTIHEYTFSGCGSITGVLIPSSVTSLKSHAFEYCSSMSVALVPSALLENLPKWAFHGSVWDFRVIGYDDDEEGPALYTVAFDPAGGECDVAEKCAAGGYSIGTLPKSVREGFTFVGWFTDKDGGELVLPDMVFDSDATLYAHWVDTSELAAQFKYYISGSVAVINAASGSLSGHVVLPTAIEGCPVAAINYRAFADCTEITSLVLPDSLVTINREAFSGCTALTSIMLPDTLKTIGYEAFSGCSSLTSIDIPDSVETIDAYAFSECSALKSVDFPASIKTIGASAFRFCRNLENIQLSDSLETLASSAFYCCSSLRDITIEGGDIGGYVFDGCSSLTNVVLGGSVSSIGSSAFSSCSALTQATISCNPTNVSENVFRWCSNLKKVYVDMPAIGEGMFKDCSNLEEVGFGPQVETIGAGAFNTCTNIKRIDIENLAKWCAVEFHDYPSSGRHIYGWAAPDLYLAGEKIVDLVIPHGVTEISSYAFDYYSIKSVTIPDSVTLVQADAFNECANMTNVVFGSGVDTIANQAFSNCRSLTSVVVPDNVEVIGDNAFYNCRALKTATIGRGVEYVGDGAFSYCYALTMALVPTSLEGSLNDTVFSNTAQDFQIVYYSGEAPDIDNIEWRTISFVANGGVCDALSKKAPLGGTVGALPAATRTGYAFAGWSRDGVEGAAVTPKTIVDGDMVLYAQWIEALTSKEFDSTGGDADWTVDADGSWKSGSIGDSQKTWAQIEVDAPCNVSFMWKVSSERNFDKLVFYIDGEKNDEITGAVDWTSVTATFTDLGCHVLRWEYVKDSGVSSGSDCGWVGNVSVALLPTCMITLDENHDQGSTISIRVAKDTAIGSLPVPYREGYGFAGWFTGINGGTRVTSETLINTDVTCYARWIAATPVRTFGSTGGWADWTIEADGSWKSGAVGDSQTTWVQIEVHAPCNVSFKWKVSSEERYDKLSYYVDDVLQESISGTTDWAFVSIAFDDTATSHTIKWEYKKDSSESSGSDCGWVTNVALADMSSSAEVEPVFTVDSTKMEIPIVDENTGVRTIAAKPGVSLSEADVASIVVNSPIDAAINITKAYTIKLDAAKNEIVATLAGPDFATVAEDEKDESDPSGLLASIDESKIVAKPVPGTGECIGAMPLKTYPGLYYQVAWGSDIGNLTVGEKVQATSELLYLGVIKQTASKGFYKVTVSEK